MKTFGRKPRIMLFAILPIAMLFLVLGQPSPLVVSAQTGANRPLSHREVKKLIETATTRSDHLKSRRTTRQKRAHSTEKPLNMLILNPLTPTDRDTVQSSIRAHMTIAKASPRAWSRRRRTPTLFLQHTETSQDR